MGKSLLLTLQRHFYQFPRRSSILLRRPSRLEAALTGGDKIVIMKIVAVGLMLLEQWTKSDRCPILEAGNLHP